MGPIERIPEVAALSARRQLIRIPPETDVPLTDRVRSVVDTAEFRRLARISQLGLVSLVYPAALHTRFEHSLGVYTGHSVIRSRNSISPAYPGMNCSPIASSWKASWRMCCVTNGISTLATLSPS